jgi:hypothetical protein
MQTQTQTQDYWTATAIMAIPIPINMVGSWSGTISTTQWQKET